MISGVASAMMGKSPSILFCASKGLTEASGLNTAKTKTTKNTITNFERFISLPPQKTNYTHYGKLHNEAADEPPAGGPLEGRRLDGSIRLLGCASVSEPQACSGWDRRRLARADAQRLT